MKKLAAILNRKFSDRLNPVWVKEMRQMLNGRALLGSAAALIIAGETFVICMVGLLFGRRIGVRLADKSEIVGGVILIGIGVEIFIKGVFFG